MVATAADRAAAEAVEKQVLSAWIKWYREAVSSAAGLPRGGSTAALRARIEKAGRGLM